MSEGKGIKPDERTKATKQDRLKQWMKKSKFVTCEENLSMRDEDVAVMNETA